MGRFAVITMTDAAAERVNEIMATRESAKGVRLGIKKGGCAGMEYTVDLVTEPKPGDDHIEQPQPVVRLRLRRIRRTEARRPEGAGRSPRFRRRLRLYSTHIPVRLCQSAMDSSG